MAGNLTTFSFANVSQLIDGKPYSGLWTGNDAISIKPVTDKGRAVMGVDGDSVVSRSAGNARMITIKAIASGDLHKRMTQINKAISQNLIGDFPYSITDTSTGEGGGGNNATILKEPEIVLGDDASPRTWEIYVADWEDNDVNYVL